MSNNKKNKAKERIGQVQLIDASKCFEARWKRIGNKRVDISEAARKLIMVKLRCVKIDEKTDLQFR